jgi:phosphopentomutase
VGDVYGIGVVPELFDFRGFRQVKRSQNNAEHGVALVRAMDSDASFIWANFEDFDMRFGHRNDVTGFGGALEEFDVFLSGLLPLLGSGDVLMLTADHGNDPTTPSTDHSREYVPFVAIGKGIEMANLRVQPGMNCVGASVAAHLGLDFEGGKNLLS